MRNSTRTLRCPASLPVGSNCRRRKMADYPASTVVCPKTPPGLSGLVNQVGKLRGVAKQSFSSYAGAVIASHFATQAIHEQRAFAAPNRFRQMGEAVVNAARPFDLPRLGSNLRDFPLGCSHQSTRRGKQYRPFRRRIIVVRFREPAGGGSGSRVGVRPALSTFKKMESAGLTPVGMTPVGRPRLAAFTGWASRRHRVWPSIVGTLPWRHRP